MRVLKEVDTNFGKEKLIFEANLNPSGQSDWVGLPKIAQILYN